MAGTSEELEGNPGGSLWDAAFSRDGRTLAMGDNDGSLQFWNVATARRIATIKAHKSILTGLDFAPDDRMLITASFDQSVRFWPAPSFDETDRGEPRTASAGP